MNNYKQKDSHYDETQDDGKSKRRNRNNHNERNFICGCGKQYLRYLNLQRNI